MEAEKLDPHGFSHLDHIGVAVEALTKYGVFEAVSRYATGLRSPTERAGAPEKFNATIAFASMSLIAERLRSGDCDDAETFVKENGALFTKAFLTDQFPEERFNLDIGKEMPLLPTDQFSPGRPGVRERSPDDVNRRCHCIAKPRRPDRSSPKRSFATANTRSN